MVKNWREMRLLGPPALGTRTDGREVLVDLGDRRPTARVRYVDADDLYVSWVWDHQLDSPRMTVLPRAEIAPVLGRLAWALPTPLAGEGGTDALRRALSAGELLDRERERSLAAALTAALIPAWLGLELNALEHAGRRPRLRVQPSPSTAQVPWEMLATSGDERTIDMVDVSALLPASLRNDPSRAVALWDPEGPVVAVVDPVVPGFPATSELGSVLGPVAEDAPLAVRMREHAARRHPPAGDDPHSRIRRDDITRERLALELQGASRLLYVGHVTASTHALDARMHLSDPATTPGSAGTLGRHRPLSAADIALGTSASAPLTAPNRVALVACDSGGDLRYAEPTGLVAAFAHRGAEYVTATRWTLPTDAGLRRFVPGLGDDAEGMLAEAVLAVDAAHDAEDPVATLTAWQRAQRVRWTETGDRRFSPLLWGAFTTTWSPPPTPA